MVLHVALVCEEVNVRLLLSTTMVTSSDVVQNPFVPVTVYVVVTVGLATGLNIFGLLRPVVGVHVQPDIGSALVAVSCTGHPGQMVSSTPASTVSVVTTTVTVSVTAPEHVPSTATYCVVAFGHTLTVVPVPACHPVVRSYQFTADVVALRMIGAYGIAAPV
jgi:hypothetical protein